MSYHNEILKAQILMILQPCYQMLAIYISMHRNVHRSTDLEVTQTLEQWTGAGCDICFEVQQRNALHRPWPIVSLMKLSKETMTVQMHMQTTSGKVQDGLTTSLQ